MCGIAALINQDSTNTSIDTLIQAMTDIITHRGPDDSGHTITPPLALGHRRLSIIDLSKRSAQPMAYQNRYTITFNGEIYNYLELKEQLKEKGYTFSTESDTEVILAAYDQWGTDCQSKFNGMWAFCIHDSDTQTLFCSRDRFGIKPLYYTTQNNLFAIASEIKQFSVLPNWSAQANHPRLMDFLIYGLTDHTTQTCFKNVSQLQGGHHLLYDLNTHTYNIQKWYTLETEHKKVPASKTPEKDYLKHLQDSLQLRLRSDVSVGSCLSGGLDSSSIVCLIDHILKNNPEAPTQKTISSCFKNKTFDEQPYIDTVTEHTDTSNHKVFPQFENLFKDLPTLIWHQDEPFASTSIFAQWNVFKTAAEQDLKVMLDGQGADEQLAGYHSFFPAHLAEHTFITKWPTLIKELVALKKRHHLSTTQLASLLIRSLLPQITTRHIRLKRFKRNYPFITADIQKSINYHYNYKSIQDMSIAQLTQMNLTMLLHFEDRNSMAHSIEARVPFLDPNCVEFIVSQPSKHKIQNGETKVILRKAMAKILPKKILTRQDKMGFVTPETQWIIDNKTIFRKELETLQNTISSLVNVPDLLTHYDNSTNDQLVEDYPIYWKLICLGTWVTKFDVTL